MKRDSLKVKGVVNDKLSKLLVEGLIKSRNFIYVAVVSIFSTGSSQCLLK